MTWDEFVQGAKAVSWLVYVGTSEPNGRPHVAPVAPGFTDNTIWFATRTGSQKFRNLSENPRAAFHWPVGGTEGPGELFARGTATLHTALEDRQRLWSAGVLPVRPRWLLWKSRNTGPGLRGNIRGTRLNSRSGLSASGVSPMTSGMTPDEFRKHGKELIDWVADYYERVESLPVTPDIKPGAIRAMLPEFAPELPEPFTEVIADLDRVVMPGITHWQSPNWFAYFPGDSSFPAILGELVSAGLAQQGMLWSTSPATTEIESHMMDWLVDLLGLPQAWKTSGPGGGVIQMSASDSTHTALVVARQRAQETASLDDIVAYGSAQAHSSIEKGARVAGYRHYRPIEVDEQFALRTDLLEAAIADDRTAGRHPAFVCSAVGTTGRPPQSTRCEPSAKLPAGKVCGITSTQPTPDQR